MEPKWLAWARQLHSLARSGLTYSDNPFEIERCERTQAIAEEIFASQSDEEPEVIAGLFSEQAGYATPKVDVRGVVFKDDKILLVKERIDGGWTLPGGWADIGDSPSRATEREVWEESGYEAKAVKLLAVYDRDDPRHGHPPHPFHIYKLVFLCELTGGEAKSSMETDGVGFFGEDEIPALSEGRTTESLLRRMFEHQRHPEWPTDFD